MYIWKAWLNCSTFDYLPTNSPRIFHVEATWKWLLPRHFNVEYTWCVCGGFSPHKKWSFLLKISSVNVTKYAVLCGFDHIYWRKSSWKTSFFVQCLFLQKECYSCVSTSTLKRNSVFLSSVPSATKSQSSGDWYVKFQICSIILQMISTPPKEQ